MNAHDAFVADLRAAGLLAEHVIADGRLHRLRTQGDGQGQHSGWYVLHLGDHPAGAYGNWKTGEVQRWHGESRTVLSPSERARIQSDMMHARRREMALRAENQARAKQEAKRRWQAATPADAAHPYLLAKAVGIYGIRQEGAHLLIPLRDSAGQLWGLQTIDYEGNKRFQRGARKWGLYHAIGQCTGNVLCIAEGYATAASVHEATGYATAVAFDAGNLEPVAVELHRKHPELQIVICADDDTATAERTGKNPGIAAAMRAASAVGGVIALPPRDDATDPAPAIATA